MEFKINVSKILVMLFIFLFLFSNLLTRISNFNFNLLFYIILFLLIICTVKFIKLNKIGAIIIVCILFYSLSILNLNTGLRVNIMSLKDVVIQYCIFFISYIFIKYKKLFINVLNKLYLIFISYGVIQEILFYKGILYKFFPWDQAIINETLLKGISTSMFQSGGLLRFWGCMNSFVEYQILVVFISILILLNKNLVKNKKILYINLILMIFFLCLAIERSPIMMLLIVLIVWKHKQFIKNFKKAIVSILIIFFGIMIVFTTSGELMKNSNINIEGAKKRLINVITLNFDKDEAIRDRKNNQWSTDAEILIEPKTFFGLGPATVASSCSGNFDGYIGPHNNFFGYYIGYGFFGLILFILVLINIIKYSIKLKNEYKYFCIGVVIAFCIMGVFNMPFFGKSGMIFFLIIGFLINDKENYKTCESEENIHEASISKKRSSYN